MLQLDQYDNQHFDRGASRWKEWGWYLVRYLFFTSSLPLPSALKVLLLRSFGASIGKGVVVRAGVSVSFPWRLKIGNHVWIGEDVRILSLAPISIGSNVCISQEAFLCTGSHDFSQPTFDLITMPIVVEDGCWVGARSFVGPGVTFEKGSRSLAAAAVVRSVPCGATVGGVPAKVIIPQKKSQDC